MLATYLAVAYINIIKTIIIINNNNTGPVAQKIQNYPTLIWKPTSVCLCKVVFSIGIWNVDIFQ